MSFNLGLSLWPPVPALMVGNLAASLDWYLRVLGFQLVSKGYSEKELASAQLNWAGYSSLLLVSGPKRSVHCVGLRYFFWTENDLYVMAARAVDHGGLITSGPVTHTWGIREVTFRDPDGYLLTFHQRISRTKLNIEEMTC